MIPTDGYAPGGTQYRIRLLDALELDVVTLDITYGDPQVMSADQIDALLRPLMETLRDQVEVEALVPGQIQLLVGHHGTRIDDITPPPPGGEG